MKKIKFYYFLLSFLLFVSCNQEPTWKKITLSSPKGDKCLTFAIHYGQDSYIDRKAIYILGDENDLNSNFACIAYYPSKDNLSSIEINWGDTIKIRDAKVIQNHLKNGKINVLDKMSDLEIQNTRMNNHIWNNYFLYKLVNGDFPKCSNK